MKKFDVEIKKATTRQHLPAGGYVAKILNAEEVSYDWGNVLLISFDIAEGDNKDHFANDYRNQDREDKKWRGTYRLRIPLDDGSERDRWSKRTFGNAIWAIEDSNSGYHWDWNEVELKGKFIGVLFRDREWEMNGRTGWSTECCALTSVSDIHSGNFKMPKAKSLDGSKSSAAPLHEVEDDEDLPF